MKTRTGWIIHAFALMHFVASLLCGLAGADDSLLLTVLTIALTLILCLRSGESIEFTIIAIVLVNVLGFGLGELLAKAFGLLLSVHVLVHALSTAAVTEALGWSLAWLAGRKIGSGPESSERERSIQMGWLIVAVAAVFLLRVFINLIFSSSLSDHAEGMSAVRDFLYNPVMLLLILAGSVLFIRYYKRDSNTLSYSGKVMTLVLFFIGMTLLSALFVGLGLPLGFTPEISPGRFIPLLVVSLIANAAIFSLVYMSDYALTANRRLEEEKARAEKARYQYLLLKQQVSPHFLFNSLNVLDSLVLDGSKEDASRFIHQLSGLYRYMLKSEEEDVVPLRDELEYSRMYASLMKMRWPDSIEFDVNVREEDKSRFVIPCSVQMCIENALKHNSFIASRPLRISLTSDGRAISVSNPLCPRVTKQESTRLGLNYIKEQYLSAGDAVEVIKTADSFTVKLPLL